jgi:hypothetical protein
MSTDPKITVFGLCSAEAPQRIGKMTFWRQAPLPKALPNFRKKRLFDFLMLNGNIRFSAECAAGPERKSVNEVSPWVG